MQGGRYQKRALGGISKVTKLIMVYCILHGRIKGFNSVVVAIMCQVAVKSSYRMADH